MVEDYYKDLLGKEHSNPVQASLFDEICPQEEPADISIEVSDLDIKESLFDIEDTKCDSPDGCTSLFFKHCWHIIGSDVFKAVHNFLTPEKGCGVRTLPMSI